MQSAQVLISGFVQGVGFRHFIRSKARELGLIGWVRNIPASDFGQQGSMEVLFVGKKESIEEIINLCRKGPFLAEVKNIEVKWQSINKKETPKSFDIVF